jgi:hypothetical protein
VCCMAWVLHGLGACSGTASEPCKTPVQDTAAPSSCCACRAVTRPCQSMTHLQLLCRSIDAHCLLCHATGPGCCVVLCWAVIYCVLLCWATNCCVNRVHPLLCRTWAVAASTHQDHHCHYGQNHHQQHSCTKRGVRLFMKRNETFKTCVLNASSVKRCI